MIELDLQGRPSVPFGEPYGSGGKLLGRFVMPMTSRYRAFVAGRHLKGRGSHLDIGCGDGLFLRWSPCRKRIGLDLRYGDEVTDTLDFPDYSFDNVTLLALLEHLAEPRRLIREIHRILTPGGRIIVTTPRRAGEWLIRLYSRDLEDDEHGHDTYYDEKSLLELTSGSFEPLLYKRFMLGFNQLFVGARR